jgi:hypothetical protein
VGSEPSDASLPVLVAPGLTASAIGHSPQRRAITIHEDTVILFDRRFPDTAAPLSAFQPRLAWFVVHRVFHRREKKSRIFGNSGPHLDFDVVPTSRRGE